MKYRIARCTVWAASLCLLSSVAVAQVAYELVSDQSEVTVDGTSNRSDWTVTASEVACEADLNVEGETVTPVSLSLTVPSAQMVSGRSTIMDRLMHGALDVDEHPEITYQLTSATPVDDGDDDPNTFTLETTGDLTLAGVTKSIDMTVEGQKMEDGHVTFSGSHALAMTDYEIDPPTAMFGALRTGDEVTVNFNTTLKPADASQSGG